MRFLAAALLLSSPVLAHAGAVDAPMDALIARHGLTQKQAEALAACERDVPATHDLMQNPSISKYCLVRHGGPRKHAMLLGVQLSAELSREGKNAASDAVDKLVDVLEQRGD